MDGRGSSAQRTPSLTVAMLGWFINHEVLLSLEQIAMLLAYATFMLGVCLPACVVPTRRALRAKPTVALRLD